MKPIRNDLLNTFAKKHATLKSGQCCPFSFINIKHRRFTAIVWGFNDDLEFFIRAVESHQYTQFVEDRKEIEQALSLMRYLTGLINRIEPSEVSTVITKLTEIKNSLNLRYEHASHKQKPASRYLFT